MRTEPDVDKIFVLMKAKSQEAAVDRMKTEVAFFNDLFFMVFKTRFTFLFVYIIDSKLFQCLKQRHEEYYQDFMLTKLVLIIGSMCESDLGMDANLMSEIGEEVDVIINSAANKNFKERLILLYSSIIKYLYIYLSSLYN